MASSTFREIARFPAVGSRVTLGAPSVLSVVADSELREKRDFRGTVMFQCLEPYYPSRQPAWVVTVPNWTPLSLNAVDQSQPDHDASWDNVPVEAYFVHGSTVDPELLEVAVRRWLLPLYWWMERAECKRPRYIGRYDWEALASENMNDLEASEDIEDEQDAASASPSAPRPLHGATAVPIKTFDFPSPVVGAGSSSAAHTDDEERDEMLEERRQCGIVFVNTELKGHGSERPLQSKEAFEPTEDGREDSGIVEILPFDGGVRILPRMEYRWGFLLLNADMELDAFVLVDMYSIPETYFSQCAPETLVARLEEAAASGDTSAAFTLSYLEFPAE
jgi:hypothetical protein